MNIELYSKYEWTPEFQKLSEWGTHLINDKKALGIAQFTKEGHNIVNRVIDKDLPKWVIDLFNVPISHVQLFSAQPHAIGSVHMDGSDRLCAFNIPVQNTDQGVMEWLDGPVEGNLLELAHTSIRLLKNKKDGLKMGTSAQIILDSPTLVNTNVWHRVDNSANSRWRHVLSIRFLNNPSYQEVKGSLSGFLKVHS